jgi:hypothetical protein
MTISGQNCGYTMYGKVCFMQLQLPWTALNGSTSSASITLPFVNTGTKMVKAFFQVGYSVGVTSAAPLFGVVSGGDNHIYLYQSNLSGGTSTNFPCTGFAASGEIQLSGWFVAT